MNQNYNFDEQYKKSVDLSTDYHILLEYARKKVQVHKLLFNTILDLQQRKNNYTKLVPLIERLKLMFKQIIVEKNKLANIEKFPNDLELYLAASGIPGNKYNYFLKNIDRFVKIVHTNFPLTEQVQKLEEQGIKEWTELNAPYGEGFIRFSTPFHSPNDIINLIAKYDTRLGKYKERIRIVEVDNDFFSGQNIYLKMVLLKYKQVKK